MLKVITVAQNKGGVGKTALVKTLAYFIANTLCKKVLLIDLDPQGNLSGQFLELERGSHLPGTWRPPVNPDYEPGEDELYFERFNSASIFRHGTSCPYTTENDSIDIIPSHPIELIEVEKDTIRENIDSAVVSFLRTWIEAAAEDYDVVLIDTGPDMKPITLSAIRAADDLIIPVELERHCLDGLDRMVTIFREQIPYRSGGINLASIVMTLYKQSQKQHVTYRDALLTHQHLKDFVCPIPIGERSHWSYSDEQKKAIFDFPKNSKARKEALMFCEHIAKRIFPGDIPKSTERNMHSVSSSKVEEAVAHG